MTLHLLRNATGHDSIQSAMDNFAESKNGLLVDYTSRKPARKSELLDGGSVYWVARGQGMIRWRTPLRKIHNFGEYTGLIISLPVVAVEPRPVSFLRGWRYLKPEDAPPDIEWKAVGDTLKEADAILSSLDELGLR